MQTSTLKPGLLVSVKTTLTGNVSYTKRDLDAERVEGSERVSWETERRIADVAEYEAAKKARSAATSAIRGVCAYSAFGLLCPESKATELDDAVERAQTIARDFNATATRTRVGIFVLTGRIAADDVEAVRAINSECRELIEAMSNGVRALDAERIRDAANRLRNLESMLTPEAAARAQEAIDAARKAARVVVKAGAQAAQEIDRNTLARIASARTAFLDLDAPAEIETPTETGRAIDFEPEPVVMAPAAGPTQLDLI